MKRKEVTNLDLPYTLWSSMQRTAPTPLVQGQRLKLAKKRSPQGISAVLMKRRPVRRSNRKGKPVQFTCYVDMDGVLADFDGEACAKHGQPGNYARPPAMRGPDAWHVERLLGLTAEEFWAPLGTTAFWAGIPKKPEVNGMVELLLDQFGKDCVYVPSSPSDGHGSVTGKREWLRTHFPLLADAGVFTRNKHVCAQAGSVLVDDHTPNVQAFREYGGHAWLVPRPWNESWEREPFLLEDLDAYLDLLMSRPEYAI